MPRGIDRNDHGPSVDLALEVWHRRKWLAIVVFGTMFAGAATLTLSLPPLYRSTATVLVERQQVSEAFVRPSVTTELETRIQTIHKEVTSRARLANVVMQFNLYPELRSETPMEAIVNRMRRDIDFRLNGVEQMSGRIATISFTVSYSGRDPNKVADVTNMLAGSYVEENTKSRERQAVRTAEFLKVQLDEAKRELDAHNQREREFTSRHANELPQQVDVNLAALDRLNTQLRLNGEYQIRAMERRDRLEHQLADADRPNAAASQRAADAPAAELARLKTQLAELEAKYSPRYPDVRRLRREISALEQRLTANEGRAEGAGVNDPSGDTSPAEGGRRLAEQSLAHVQEEIASLKREEGVLRRLIADYEARVESAPRRQEELQQLSRDFASSKERYETLLKRYEEAKVAETLEQGQNVEQFRILDPAIPALAPVAPNTMWLLAMGLVGSLGLAFAAVVVSEKIDTSFHSADDLRGFAAVPTLAVIGRIPTQSDLRGQQLRFALAVVAVLVGLVVVVGGARYVGSGNEQIVRMTARGQG
ncbi:MAG TPA: GNVR domain-containing protein [Vicinamibacterales bacterium]|nr:GNVR domain-containing protein [Vicinamibacterales bacterium]